MSGNKAKHLCGPRVGKDLMSKNKDCFSTKDIMDKFT